MRYYGAPGDLSPARRKTLGQAEEGPQDPDMAAVKKEIVDR